MNPLINFITETGLNPDMKENEYGIYGTQEWGEDAG